METLCEFCGCIIGLRFPETLFCLCLKKMKSGELRELHELKFVGRIRYEPPKAFSGLLETAVRYDSHSLLSTSLTLDFLIADDFFKTSERGSALTLIKLLSTTESYVLMHFHCVYRKM